jgi:hypothetical protein
MTNVVDHHVNLRSRSSDAAQWSSRILSQCERSSLRVCSGFKTSQKLMPCFRYAVIVESSSLIELESVGCGGVIEDVNLNALNSLAKQR